ncbi:MULTISPECIES: hypothetical protein [unclassified Streptomyces]|uniref:hypothetical protein n=1 Tax=unclassified Streptomyces TaxID=2593676 RepID=UPI001EF7F41A|nr:MULTISPECIES: hypothetical protein [unclassified Streptomyces]
MYRVDTATFQLTATVELPPGEGYTGFTEVDPAAGAVWVGLDTSVVVHDADSRRTGVIKGTDLPRAARFDAATHRAYVVWQDSGDTSQPGSDNNGVPAVYHATDLKEAAATTVLPANHGQLGFASLAVAPGGAVVFVSNPAEGRIARLERSVSPTVTQGPTDRTVTAGERVVLTADAYGTPKPAVAWQVSADAGRTWQPVEAGTSVHSFTAQAADNGRCYRAEFRNTAGTSRTKPITLTVTAAGTGTDGGTGTPGTPGTSGSTGGATTAAASTGAASASGSGSGGTVGGTGATANDGSLASTGAGAATLATAAAALTATGWILVRRRRRTGSPRAAS